MSATLSPNDWAVLAKLAEGEAHGFSLAACFAKHGELGFLWRVQRPQVYRALVRLERLDFILCLRQEEGGAGPPRLVYGISEVGRHALEAWLYEAVGHVRDGRSELLLKLCFLERLHLPTHPLLEAQQRSFLSLKASIERQSQNASVNVSVLLWRKHMVCAALAFVEECLDAKDLP